jgi:uncharacterized protein YegP (UPF0339 family)
MKIKVVRKTIFWYVKLVGDNGETLMVSETYFSKTNAERAGNKLKLEMKLK